MSKRSLDAFIYGGLRSPFGRHGGALATIRSDDLAGQVLCGVVSRYEIDEAQIDDVILGCANQAGEDCRNVARNAVLAAGLSVRIPGVTVNRLCASGLAAIVDAARAIRSGDGRLFLAGGVESMTRAPFVTAKSESAFSREVHTFDTTIGARFPNPKVLSRFGAHSMPETGDQVAKELQISRIEVDRFAERSQVNFESARQRGFFKDEILAIELPKKKGDTEARTFSSDEYPRPDSTYEKLSRLSPLFPGGVVTAGNASGINDGAVVVVVGDESYGEKAGRSPLAAVRSSVAYGIEPRIMGLGPVEAIKKLLHKNGLVMSDIDVFEINEAFASQVLGCLKLLDIPFDDSRVNPNGGAIAVGHPLGASGARLVLTAARQLNECKGRYAVVSLCVGMGQGLAVLIERAVD